MTAQLCRKCGIRLDAWLTSEGLEYHPPCDPNPPFDSPPPPPGQANNQFALALRDEISDIILWANKTSTRSQQTELGASELGGECLRKLGYRIADQPPVNNENDPWPAIVGTAIHEWLEKVVLRYEQTHTLGRWKTEMTVHPNDYVKGHTDLYDTKLHTVIDYKTAGTEKMREIRKGNIPADYIQQVNLYALGHLRAGRRVENVALIFFPRSGWLSGTYVWSAPFDRKLAEAALEKVNKVATGLIYYKVTEIPENWVKVPATPSKECSYCPWYNPSVDVANIDGCPAK